MCFQIGSELQFGRHILDGNQLRVEYAIKIINNAKDLIPPPFKAEIVAKLSRHYNDDIRTAIIIRNVKTHNNLIERLDIFDQAGPSSFHSGNNAINNYHSRMSFPNVYG